MTSIGNTSIANGVVAFPNAAKPIPTRRDKAMVTNAPRIGSARVRERTVSLAELLMSRRTGARPCIMARLLFRAREASDSAVTDVLRDWTISSSRARSALDELGPELDSLLVDVGAPICARRLWLTVWADSFVEYTPWTFWVRERGELVAVGLLAVRARAGHHEIVGLGHGPSDYARLPARSPEAAQRLAETLAEALRRRRRPWRLRIDGLPPADPVATRLAEQLRHATVVRGEGAPHLLLRAERPVEAVMKAKDRHSLHARRRRLSKLECGYSLRTERGVEACTNLEDVERVHQLREHAVRRTSDLDKTSARNFWRDVLAAYGALGEVEVSRLVIGTDLAAYSIGLLDGRSWRLWDTRFNPAYRSVAPGRVLITDVMERLQAEGGWDEFDYMRGEEDYKRRLSDGVVPAEHLRAWSSAGLRRLEQVFRAGRSRLRGGD
jgi:CelD/BcsL family acetyltransferase involved in cellulose biosynthesis